MFTSVTVFDRDIAVVLQVLGEINGGHAAGTKLALDGVAVSDRGFQPIDLGVHAIRKMEAGGRGSQS